jgi:hypothetical protein
MLMRSVLLACTIALGACVGPLRAGGAQGSDVELDSGARELVQRYWRAASVGDTIELRRMSSGPENVDFAVWVRARHPGYFDEQPVVQQVLVDVREGKAYVILRTREPLCDQSIGRKNDPIVQVRVLRSRGMLLVDDIGGGPC